MKHTPGPWRFNAHGAIFGPGGEPIQTCGEYAIRFGEGTEEAFANARLIAAAPDLLKACKMAFKDLEPFEWTDLPDGYAVLATVRKLRAAIKKAELMEERKG